MSGFYQRQFFFIIIILVSVSLVGYSNEDDTEALLKTVNKELRNTERDMFSGKTEKAIASLEKINTMLLKIKADDPNNPKLKTAENKYKKLVKDLERRTGKDLGGGTLTAAAVSTETQMAPKPATTESSSEKTQSPSEVKKTEATSSAAKLPYEARKPMSDAERNLSSIERDLNKLADPGYGGNKDQLVSNMEKKIDQVKKDLNQAKEMAAAKGVISHPDFDEVESKIASAEKSIAAATSGYEEVKAAASASAKEVDADVAELKAVYDKVQPVFNKASGNVFHYNDMNTLEDVITDIENFEKNDFKTVETKMFAFSTKYGTTKDEIDKKAESMGYSGTYYRASYPYTELAVGIENVAKTRDIMAEDLVRRVKSELDGISKGAELNIIERYEKVKIWLAMAVRYQADNPKVKELYSTIDARIEKGMKEFNTRVDGRTWPDHASDAPSNADELAEAALDWFKNSPDWGKRSSKIRHPLAVTVTGPWSIQKRNLLGEPIMYGLPIKLAVEVDEDKELNVARVYDLTMRTGEYRGVKMEPPFNHITVGNSYFIRPDKVN
jgi:hypothetical protein